MTQLPSVEQFERASLKAWPGIEVDWDGSWVRRAAAGYTKRANSLQCFDPADGDNAPERLAAGMEWFKARQLPPVIRTTPLASPALSALLDAEAWGTFDHSHLYAMPLGAQEPDSETRVMPVLDETFLAVQQTLQDYSEHTMAGMRGLLGAMAVPAAGIVVYRQNIPVASAVMAIGDGIVITGNVVTDPARRRQGLAAAVMRTGLAWASSEGATTAALNVSADNPGAQALYRGLGYVHQYDYTYRIEASS